MEQPMFYQGQRVVCVDAPNRPENGCGDTELIEGKSYYIENGSSQISNGRIYVAIVGLMYDYLQTSFVPYDTDKALEDEIFEALKEDLKIKI